MTRIEVLDMSFSEIQEYCMLECAGSFMPL